MLNREQISKIIRMKGPVLPVHVSKEIGTTILFASAMLSEMVSAKILKVSNVKIGSSPLYYFPEQKSRLQEFSKYLPQKEKEAYELLKGKKVLRESEQEPAIKVALRNIKDYAWPLRVTTNSNKEIFWKWYLTENEEAGAIIKEGLGIKKEIPKPEHPAEAKEEHPKKPVEEKTPIVKPEKTPEIKKEFQQKITGEVKGEKNIKKEEPIPCFTEQIVAFFSKNNIRVLNKEIIKKHETDFIIELQSAVGNLRYYCKAKSKKRIGDGDLSSAYVQGELRKLPVLFLSSGEPTKKAAEMLNKEFQNIVFKKIGRD